VTGKHQVQTISSVCQHDVANIGPDWVIRCRTATSPDIRAWSADAPRFQPSLARGCRFRGKFGQGNQQGSEGVKRNSEWSATLLCEVHLYNKTMVSPTPQLSSTDQTRSSAWRTPLVGAGSAVG